MLFHEAGNPQIHFIKFPGFSSLSPGGAFSLLWGLSSPSGVSLVFGRMTSLLVTDEAFAVPHVFSSFTGREVDFVYMHGVGIPGWCSGSVCLSWQNEAVSPTPEFPKLYHVLVNSPALSVTILFPHYSILLFIHTHRLLTWRGRRHSYINTSYLFICTLSSFCFLDLSMDIANS